MQDQQTGARRFVASDMASALKMLTDTYGAEALLLSSRNVSNGVEVVGMAPGAAVKGESAELAANLHSERRSVERRQRERRAVAATPPAVDPQAGSRAATVEDPGRRQFGDTLAKLSSEHAGLFGQEHGAQQAAANPATNAGSDIRAAASALAQRIGGLAANGLARPVADESGPVASAGPQGDALQTGLQTELQIELRQIRRMLEGSLHPLGEASGMTTPERYLVQHRLARTGLSPSICKALVDSVAASETADVAAIWRACRAKLSAMLPVLEQDPLAAPGVLALVGPAGAGKSSMLALLLARAIANRQQGDIAIFYREGALDSRLAELAELVQVPYLLLQSAQPFGAQFAAIASRKTILIDSSAEARLDAPREREAAELGVRELLVLPATGAKRFLNDAVAQYRSPRSYACALSFVQRAGGLGEALSLLLRERLALAYLGTGLLLPEHLEHPDANCLLDKLGFAGDMDGEGALLSPLLTEQVAAGSPA